MEQKRLIPVLSIAGSDSCGGAGIQADIKTISALGGYAMTAVTAVTAQNTLGVRQVQPVTPDMTVAQIEAVFDDAPLRPLATKIGMLHDAATVESVSDTLHRYSARHIVVDPVLVATSGSELFVEFERLKNALITRLFPLAEIVTPNVHEAQILTGTDDIDGQLRVFHDMGCANVLLKGGDRSSGATKTDYLSLDGGRQHAELTHPAIVTRNTHGTGCTLSSAIATFLARGYSVGDAVRCAIDYVTGAIEASAGLLTGSGHGSLNHFYESNNQ